MSDNNFLIVGSGLMGSGIAQVCAQSGINVILNDISQEADEWALRSQEKAIAALDSGVFREEIVPTLFLRGKEIQ